LNIVYVTNEYIDSNTFKVFDGGLANYLYKITTYLAKLGHNITVIVANSSVDKQADYNGVHVFWVSNIFEKTLLQKILFAISSKKMRTKMRNDAIWNKVNKLIKKLHEEKTVDIIQYTNCLAQFTGKYLNNIPYCIRISSYAKLWQKYYNYSKEEIKNEISQFKNAEFLYGPSKYVADYIKKDLKLKQEIKIIETPFIPSFYEEDCRLSEEITQKTNNKYLLFYGTISALKGAVEISNSIYQILSEYKDLYLVIIGKQLPIGNELPVDIIKNSAKEHAQRIIWYDRQQHKTLFPIIKNAFAVILPSRVDNLPNTCIEAMSLKKIVIGSRGASFEQLITNGENGLLCEANNSQSIIEAVNKLMNMPDLEITNMEQKAYERTLLLAPEKISSVVLDYYNHVIKNWRKK